MPELDRRITVLIQQPGTRNMYGEYVPGAVVRQIAWGFRTDRSLSDIVETGGLRNEAQRTYRIRWDRQIMASEVANLSFEDGSQTSDGTAWNWDVVNMVERTGRMGQDTYRRRWIDLTGVYTS